MSPSLLLLNEIDEPKQGGAENDWEEIVIKELFAGLSRMDSPALRRTRGRRVFRFL